MHQTALETTQLRHTDFNTTRVGLLGVGLMGSAMAGRLLDQGIAVIAWDRDAEHVRAIESRGAEAAKEPREVVSGAGVVITMLPTAAIILDLVEPLLDEWPQGTIWLQMSSVGAADMVGALAESMQLCEAMGLDQQQFVALLDGGPLGSAYAVQKLDEMRRHEYPAGFPVRLALKDLKLVREVEQSSEATMPLLDVVLERFTTANQDLAAEDVAAVYEISR